jgi:hypothetical protein
MSSENLSLETRDVKFNCPDTAGASKGDPLQAAIPGFGPVAAVVTAGPVAALA